MARGADLAGEGDYEGASRAYDNATQLFRRSIDDVESALAKAEPPPGGATIGNKPAVTPSNPSSGNPGSGSTPDPAPTDKPADKPAEPAGRGNATPPPVDPIPRPPKTDPPKVAPIPVRPTIESAVQAYAAAMTRKDTQALLQVYPNAPREVLEGFKRTDTGVGVYSLTVNIEEIRYITPTRARAECVFYHNFSAAGSRKPQSQLQQRAIVLDRRDDSWFVTDITRR